MGRLQFPFSFSHLFLLIYCFWINCFLIVPILNSEIKADLNSTRNSLRSSIVLRNFSREGLLNNGGPFRGNSRLFNKVSSSPELEKGLNFTNASTSLNSDRRGVSDINKNDDIKVGKKGGTLEETSKIAGVIKDGSKDPEELIRNALINHTLEHGGEQDLDKLVFSALPKGKKLVFRTVRIIRTDENGDPMDEEEDSQPTYWDVTLTNATDDAVNDDGSNIEDEDEEEEEDDEGEGSEGDEIKVASSAFGSKVNVTGKKKSDLLSSGSHAAANYHHLNDYKTSDREKEQKRTNYHGNNHGKTHKQTYTVTDGKDVKPYHGTETGLTNYANDQGGDVKDHGERFKTSKRKNKGRKVSGFKRVYHKEEFQRTEHFFDDEEANKIAESFGLSESKGAGNHGTKGDKRKYQGVHTEYLDGKKHENEHGVQNGYNKGQHTSYDDTEKHSHHSNYGKSMSSHHHQGGNSPVSYHHQTQNHNTGYYHPNHNYHASHSAPSKHTVSSHSPQSNVGGILNHKESVGIMYRAPMATSFTVTEYTPVHDEVTEYSPSEDEVTSTPDPLLAVGRTKTVRSFPISNHHDEGSDLKVEEDVYEEGPRRRRPRKRKRPRENKMFYSPKHRPIQEVEESEPEKENNPNHLQNFSSYTKEITPYPTSSVIGNVNEEFHSTSPFAPNFGPPRKPMSSPENNNGKNHGMHHRPHFRRFPRPWMWLRNRHRRPGPTGQDRPHSTTKMKGLPLVPATATYPILNPMSHLASIPLRHANAYNKLMGRGKHHQNHYFHQQQHPGQISYYELSTRKSDVIDDNYNFKGQNQTEDKNRENDVAHYFNHNHRYAKNHLTSTIQPPPTDSNGVRNTLLDPVPGMYSTMIKVLPATMLNVNESTSQSNFNDYVYNHNSLLGPSTLIATTRHPLSVAESISFTTELPPLVHHHPLASPQSHQAHQSHLTPQQNPQIRPFLPKNKWLTFSLNFGNPNFELGHEFGPAAHPFGHNSKKVSHIMQGIKHGIFRPFSKVPIRSQSSPVAAPSVIPPPHRHPSIQHMPQHRAPLTSLHSFHHLRHQPHPHLHPSFQHHSHPVPYFNPIQMHQYPMNLAIQSGLLPLGSKKQPQTLPAPLTSPTPHGISGHSNKPKFYYDYKLNVTFAGGAKSENSTSKNNNNNGSLDVGPNQALLYKPTLKVSSTSIQKKVGSTLVTLSSTTSNPSRISVSASSSSSTTKKSESRRGNQVSSSSSSLTSSSQSPPEFINGIMDTVADIFGTMG